VEREREGKRRDGMALCVTGSVCVGDKVGVGVRDFEEGVKRTKRKE
jgi:hypothetical protein